MRRGQITSRQHQARQGQRFHIDAANPGVGVDDRQFIGVDVEHFQFRVVPGQLTQGQQVGCPAGIGLKRRPFVAIGGGIGNQQGIGQGEALPSGGQVEGQPVAAGRGVAPHDADVGILDGRVAAGQVGEQLLSRGPGGHQADRAIGIELLGDRRDARCAQRHQPLDPAFKGLARRIALNQRVSRQHRLRVAIPGVLIGVIQTQRIQLEAQDGAVPVVDQRQVLAVAGNRIAAPLADLAGCGQRDRHLNIQPASPAKGQVIGDVRHIRVAQRPADGKGGAIL